MMWETHYLGNSEASISYCYGQDIYSGKITHHSKKLATGIFTVIVCKKFYWSHCHSATPQIYSVDGKVLQILPFIGT